MYKLTGFLFFTYMTFKNPTKHRIVRNLLIARLCRLRFSFLSFQITKTVLEDSLGASLFRGLGRLQQLLTVLICLLHGKQSSTFPNFSYNFLFSVLSTALPKLIND
jgi:hypothetical protein